MPLGATFKVPVVLTGGTDIASVPLQIPYDPAKLSLVNVDSGDFLGRDGQAVALLHRDDGPGMITDQCLASAGSGRGERNGRGLRPQLPGQGRRRRALSSITRPGAVNSTQQQLPAQGARVSIQVK